jgi:hypothetical protein
MARLKKAKTVRVSKPRKPIFKKVKNSFLEIGRSYDFHFNPKDLIRGKLLAVNSDEFLLDALVPFSQTIVKRSAIIMVAEFSPSVEELKKL